MASILGYIEYWIFPILFLYKNKEIGEIFITNQNQNNQSDLQLAIPETQLQNSIYVTDINQEEVSMMKKKPNIPKLIGLICATVIVILINISSFVLSTFFDITKQT
uniref:Uncharacterized protein n=1 Tax=Spironucleus salmonicida TaxID=348837 RepID=V6LXJ5_9EUKA|eukprot:EST49270.1 Hypothetical protein SS50377_10491 [Spironucleus salmonicida]